MTTEARPDDSVPAYFYAFAQKFTDYAVENERQHGVLGERIIAAESSLGQRITELEGSLGQRITEVETRLVRWMIGMAAVVVGAMAIMVSLSN